MPEIPAEQNSNNTPEPETNSCQIANQEPVVRKLTQTDRLNQRLLVSVLEKMNKSDGQFDMFMQKDDSVDESDDNDFEQDDP